MKEHKDIKVLIVEDSHLVCEMVKGVVEEIGYSVVGEAANGLEAVEMTELLRPDVVLMDIEMPDVNGIEASHLIRERCPTPIVVLTAYETPEMVVSASEAGVGAYLVKPPDAREMERAIIIALARFQDIMELRRLNAELREALSKVNTLRGLLPICAHCKKIRDDRGYWNQVEVYIQNHSEAEFTHSLCPDCMKKYFPEFYGDENGSS